MLSGASASASPPPRPDLLAADVNLMYTQLPGGDLVIGDRHEYAAVVDPFRAESRDRILLERAAELVGRASDDLVVVQRWQGVYASAPETEFLTASLAPGVQVVSVTSGIGMTTAFGLAATVIDSMLT